MKISGTVLAYICEDQPIIRETDKHRPRARNEIVYKVKITHTEISVTVERLLKMSNVIKSTVNFP